MRDEALKLWEIADTHNKLLIIGPPGVGKSVLFWAWACRQGKPVTWIEMTSGAQRCIRIHDGKIDQLPNIELSDVKTCKDEILIVDGLREGQADTWAEPVWNWKEGDPNRKAIIVASQKISSKLSQRHVAKIHQHIVNSWTLEEYITACRDDNFWETVKDLFETANDPTLTRDQVVKNKYALVGGSARWMFGGDENFARREIEEALKSVSDYSTIFKGLQGPTHSESVNRLLSVFRTDFSYESTLISHYVGVRIARRCRLEFLHMAWDQPLRKTNPSWDGWIFQIDVFHNLERCKESGQPLRVWEHSSHVPRIVPDTRQEDVPPEGQRMFGMDIGIVGSRLAELKSKISKLGGTPHDVVRGFLTFAIIPKNELKKLEQPGTTKIHKLRDQKIPLFLESFLDSLATDPNLRDFANARQHPAFMGPDLPKDYQFQMSKYFTPEHRVAQQIPPTPIDFSLNTSEVKLVELPMPVVEIIEYWKKEEIKAEHLKPNYWFMPLKWNEACFDVVHYMGGGKVRIIQITRARE
jgi:hypothetical protein